MVDVSEVGKYGTIRLLKNKDPDTIIASFPIDEEVVTFGRAPDCSIRLYYAWVSSLHCKILFEEKKAFLEVLGANGVTIDGTLIVPNKSSNSPTIIPLVNGASFEIHKKRFQFSYPPKELRPQLFTPMVATRRKSLRMSMIKSAQVFSPRPSPNPKENLRILKSPLKPFANARGRMIREADVEPEEEVKLVDGDHPKVFEAEQDLIIFEDVEPLVMPSNAPATPTATTPVTQTPAYMQPQSPAPPPLPHIDLSQKQPPMTPRRRSVPSLHRAVLIRSAQRAAIRQEMQVQRMEGINWGGAMVREEVNENENEDEKEALEVEEAVSAIMEEGEDAEMEEEEEYEEMRIEDTNDDHDAIQEDEDDEAHDEDQDDLVEMGNSYANQLQDANEDEVEQDITENDVIGETSSSEEEDEPQIPPGLPQTTHTPSRTPTLAGRTLLGAFMTPQTKPFPKLDLKANSSADKDVVHAGPQRPAPGSRFSLGSGLAGMWTPWKGRESLVAMEIKQEKETADEDVRQEKDSEKETKVEVKRELTEEEKNAIRLRRRSAVLAPTPDFTHVPGLGARRTSALPGPISVEEVSPFKSIRKELEEGETDVKEALKKMREKVENWKSKDVEARTPSPEKRKDAERAGAGLGSNAEISNEGGHSFSLFSPAAKRFGPAAVAARRKSLAFGGFGASLFGGSDVVMEETESQLQSEEQGTAQVVAQEGEEIMEVDKDVRERTPVPSVAALPKEKPVPSTPRMDGLRTLFRPPMPIPSTPRFEGVKEMLGMDEVVEQHDTFTPTQDAAHHEEQGGEYTVNSTPRDKPPSKTRPTPARSKTAARHNNTATDASTMADDEDTSADMTFGAVAGMKTRTIGSRDVKVDEAIMEDEDVEEEQVKEVIVEKKRGRGRPKKAVKADESDDEMNIAPTNDEAADCATSKPPSRTAAAKSARTPTTRTTRARTASVEPSNEESSDVLSSLPAATATKPRTRKPRSRTESNDADTEGDTTNAGMSESSIQSYEVTKVGPPRGAKKITAGSKRSSLSATPSTRRTRSASVEQDSEDVSGSIENSTATGPEADILRPASKTGRKGRQAASTVDIGETIVEEDELELKPSATKAAKSKTAAAKGTAKTRTKSGHVTEEDSRTAASATVKKRAPARRTTAATASSTEGSTSPVDEDGKENDRPKAAASKSRLPVVKARAKAMGTTTTSESESATTIPKPAARTRTVRARK